MPTTEVVALTPEQVALLLDAADHTPSPWLGPWTVLAAATGARNGELCGLEWADLDLDAGTVRFRQALTIIDPAVLPDAADARRRCGWPGARTGGRAGQVHCQQRHPRPATVRRPGAPPAPPPAGPAAPRLRAAPDGHAAKSGARPAAHPVQLDLVFRTERGTPINPNHASRAFAHLAASAGLDAHPHMLRHALASAMAANKEPASIIAAQLRHADGGALAQRVYIHQLPQTAPRLAGLIEGVFGPAARTAGGVGWASGGGKPEGNPTLEPGLIGRPRPRFRSSEGMWQGQDSNLCRQCRRFYRSHRRLLAGPVPSLSGSDHRS